MRIAILIPLAAVAATLVAAPGPARAAERAAASPSVATVNGRVISASDYEQALSAAVRARFYHRAPPEGEMAAFRREVADSLIELALVSEEARKRGLEVDPARLEADLARIESRFRDLPGWAERRGPQVARWRADLEERYLAEALEKRVRSEVRPSPEAVRRFYDENPALFTEPEKVRMALILLKVDPSAGKAARERARDEAAAIRQRLARGADFAELARIHSGDDSAAKGGDLGFVHRGALPEAVQAAADRLDGGQVSDPIDILEGIAIIRVSERKPAEHRPYEAVADRAGELLRRKASDEAWRAFVDGIRAGAKVEVDTHRYPELAAVPETAKAALPATR